MNLLFTLDEENIIDILNNFSYNIKSYKKGFTLYFEGDTCNSYDLILDGKVSIQSIDEEGNIEKLCTFKKGETLGEVLIFSTENKYPLNVICLENSKILHIDKDALIKICQEDKYFLESILFQISNKALELKNKLKVLTSKSLRSNIINFLLKQEKIQNSKVIKLEETKTELASYFSVQRTSLSRELKKMKEENMIDYDSKTITIINID